MSTHTKDINKGEIAAFDTLEAATAAIKKLGEAGFPIEHVSMLTKNLESSTEVHGFYKASDLAKTEAGFGAWVGGFFGILGGAALLIVPGVGPVVAAGSLATMIIGGIEGATGLAAVGAIVGGITGHFVSKKHIPKLVEHFSAGKYILVVQSESDDDLAKAREILGEAHVKLED